MPLIRLNKFLAERTGLSRREADEAIAAHQVTINGAPATLGSRVDKSDKVCYNGSMVSWETNFSYFLLNKPVGYVCSRRAQGQSPTIYDILPEKLQKLKTVGRLDKDSSGLILLTDDGDFAYQMTHPKFVKTKIYHVKLDKPLEPLHQQMIADYGIQLTDGVSRLGLVRLDDGRSRWEVTMSEGRNRQIRRTFAALGYTVKKLHRLEFGPYKLGQLSSGEYEQFYP